MNAWKLSFTAAALASLAACQSSGGGERPTSTPPAPVATSGSTGSAGSGTTGGTSSTGATGNGSGTTMPGTGTTGAGSGGGSGGSGGVPTLINVNLQNVLNNLSVSLQVNRNSIPVTAQVPIDVAAAVCGVSVDALAASFANGHGTCNATTTSPQLNQIVQQQISTGGNVQGGDQSINNGKSG